MDADAWNARYAAAQLVWSASDLPAGRALDVAWGEGRDAIWLV